MCCWRHFLAWINHSSIAIHKLLVLDGSLHYVQCVTYAEFCRYFYCLAWFGTVEYNCLPCPNNEVYDDAVFADRFHCQLTMFGIRVLIGLSLHHHAHIADEIDTAKIIAACCRISCCFAWFDTVEFNRLTRPNNKMYEDVVFDYRFPYRWAMLEVYLLTGLSRLLDIHIAYEIAI